MTAEDMPQNEPIHVTFSPQFLYRLKDYETADPGLSRIGTYHTHPDGITIFASKWGRDLFTVFQQPWHVNLIVSTHTKQVGCFYSELNGSSSHIQAAPGFH